MDIRETISELCEKYNIEGTGIIENHKKDLIFLIKYLPFIYDRKDPNFNSFSHRDEAWSALSEIFKTTKKEVKMQWKALCDAKQYYDSSESEDDHDLFSEMEYLNNCSINIDESHSVMPESILVSQNMDVTDENAEETPCNDNSCTLAEPNSDINIDDLPKLEDLEEKYNLFPDVKEIEDLLFARYIAHELRKITCPIKREQVQNEILRLIASYAEAGAEAE